MRDGIRDVLAIKTWTMVWNYARISLFCCYYHIHDMRTVHQTSIGLPICMTSFNALWSIAGPLKVRIVMIFPSREKLSKS